MKFEHGAIGLVAALVAVLIATSFARPPAGVTVAPKAVFGRPDAAPRAAGMDEAIAQAKGVRAGIGAGESETGVLPRGLDYDLAAVNTGEKAVPRLILASLPENLAGVRENSRRKAFFFKAVLPLILQVNEEIGRAHV